MHLSYIFILQRLGNNSQVACRMCSGLEHDLDQGFLLGKTISKILSETLKEEEGFENETVIVEKSQIKISKRFSRRGPQKEMHTKCQATRMYISREQKNLSPLMMPHRLCLFFSKSIGHNLTIHDTRIPILGCETASASWMCYQKATSSNDANHS